MSQPTYHSGKNSKAFVGTATANVELDLVAWSVNPSREVVKFRTSKTGNFSQKETTFEDCTFSVTVQHLFDASPYGSTGGNLSLTSGTCAAQLFLSGTSGASWNFAQAILTSNPQSAAVDGAIQTTFNFESNGSWTEPTASP